MNVDLLVYKDGQPLKTVSVTLPVIIGRGKDATFTIKHPLLSRKHCEIFEENGDVQVRDLDSLNGTFVNSSRVENISAVDSGSQLKLGSVVMEVQYNGAVSESAITSDHEAEDFDLGTIDTAETEVMSAASNETEPAPEATPAPVDLGDFEMSPDVAAEPVAAQPAGDLSDFEVSPASPPSAEMLDLVDFEGAAPAAEEPQAAQDLPSLTDLVEAPATEPVATPAPAPAAQPAAAEDAWAAPSEQPKVTDDDDDLDAFLKDLG
jgi:predicted component of type VI protein secretion system